MAKLFPIRQGVACQLKWTWNTLRLLEATSASCHRVVAVPLTTESFDDFHNHPTWIQHRQEQLAGRFPQQGCQYCERIEAQGGVSDRLAYLDVPDLYPPELDTDHNSLSVTPRILEVFINNACNMACVYCDESNSTRIQKENEKFGHSVPGVESNQDNPVKNIIPIVPRSSLYQQLLEKFFQWLDRNYTTLKRLQILGGEPFYQQEFSRLIEYVISSQHRDLELNVVTNLMVSRNVLERFVERMKQALIQRRIGRLDITASLDCLGPEQVYARHGIDLDVWKENFEYLASHKWLYISVNSTITSLTIKTMPDLIEYLNSVRTSRNIHHGFNIVDGRPWLDPGIMEPGYWQDDFQRILSVMPDHNALCLEARNRMQGIAQVIDAGSEDLTQQRNLRYFLDEIDRRRALDWRSVYPWLANKLDQINVVF
jgi:pyruvate-formate lyase-activating enzyme